MTRNEQLHGFWYFLLLSGVITVDRVTKNWALEHCIEPTKINEFISLELIYNRGISWGLLNSDNQGIFLFVNFLILCVIIGLMLYTFVRWNNTHWIIGEVLVLAGALSNMFDRVVYGGVVDFILLSARGYCWPYFNVADAGIVLGVGLMVIAVIWES